MCRPPFGEPGVCSTIALFSYTTNQFPIGGFFSTASFRLKQGVNEMAAKAAVSDDGALLIN
jgi:hypothetical protein